MWDQFCTLTPLPLCESKNMRIDATEFTKLFFFYPNLLWIVDREKNENILDM